MITMSSHNIRSLATELDQTMSLVNELVREIQAAAAAGQITGPVVALASSLTKRPDLAQLPAMMLRAYGGIMDALGGIQRRRETIQAFEAERLTVTQKQLSEVSTATESATIDIMDGLDRSLALIDQAQSQANAAGSSDLAGSLELLRAELNQLFGHLQFHDITTQQLGGVGALLDEIEALVTDAARLFDQSTDLSAGDSVERPAGVFNPTATFADVKVRQAAIDAAFAKTPPLAVVARA
ncbi:MAG: hypothetical protein ABI647_10155 [Gemmatimonadota bacterium]